MLLRYCVCFSLPYNDGNFLLCLTSGASRGALIIFRRENKCRGRRSSKGVADCAAGLLDLGGATKNGDAVKSSFVCLALLLCGAVAVAQEPDAQPLQLGDVTFSGSIRERYEAWDWFAPASGNNLYSFSGTVVRFGFSQKHEHYDWNIEFLAPILLGVPNHAVNPAPLGQYGIGGSYYAANDNSRNAAFISPKQAFLRIKGEHASVRMGRMEFTDGSEATPKDATLASLKADRIGQRLI